jgi:Fic family protein
MNKAGTYKVNLSGESAYKSYSPNPLPIHPELIMDKEMIDLLVKVNKEVALLENISNGIPNIDLFISMYVRKEALMSSQIEGTQATLEDILDPSIDENVNVNVKDVVNYVKAINFSIERLKELPLCNRLIKETHAVLMEGVRGQDKSPGDFRHSQNWLGGSGSTLKTARYIPPNVKDMIEAISELEKYMNIEDDSLDVFIKAALIHYQFETIHPFLDGNGRIGRLLIQLYLIQHKVLSTPSLYLSYFLKKYRIEYYDRLTEVRRTGDFEQWVKFFLRALYESAENANLTIRQLVFLHTINVETLSKIGRRSMSALLLLSYIEKNPIIELRKASNDLGLTFATVSKIVDIMINNGILIQYSGVKRNRTFAYDAYLQLLREGTE